MQPFKATAMNTDNRETDRTGSGAAKNKLNRDIHRNLQRERFPEANMAKESRKDAEAASRRNSPAQAETHIDDSERSSV